MIEFNTEDDIDTIMSYMRHEIPNAEYIIVDIEALTSVYEGMCKLMADEWLYDILNREV